MEFDTFFSGQEVPLTTSFLWSEDGQLIESVFVQTKPDDEGKVDIVRNIVVSEVVDGVAVHRLHQDGETCRVCGRDHDDCDPCVTPRGILPATDKVRCVSCPCCGTAYWANSSEYKAAGGSVCPYCLTDTRTADSSVIVHTLIEAMPHEFLFYNDVHKARNFLGELVDFNGSHEVREKRTKRRKAKRAS